MYTPIKRDGNGVNEMAFHTPPAQSSFRKELGQVLRERNLLTAKTRKKVCSMLDRSNDSMCTPEVDKRRGFRLQAIEEIISSEKTYLSQLELLMQFFVRPLKEQAIIDDGSHMLLFGQIEMIHNLNGEFLQELEHNRENVAGAFLKIAPFFKLYSVYAFDYRNALLILQDVTSKNPVFRKYLEQTESRPEVQRKLNSLMIVPIQRVPRYKLLLEQVLLYTSPADSDFKLLKESIKQIESTVSHINACIEDQEVTQLLIYLQNSLVNRTPHIVKPSRKVIKEGILQKVTRHGTEIKRYCVLMSDIFMYCKILKDRPANTVVENSLECCCIFPLKKCKVYEMFPGTFKLTCQGDGIIFSTGELQLGRIWVSFLRDAIDLHIRCRQTLRKESSKRKPMRKNAVKNFGADHSLSPSKRKCDYETLFRHRSESEEELDTSVTTMSCFSCRRSVPETATQNTVMTPQPTNKKGVKRPAPPPPTTLATTTTPSENRLAKLYKFIGREGAGPRGILKPRAGVPANIGTTAIWQPERNASFGLTARCSSASESYFRAHTVDSTIPMATTTAIATDAVNFRDALYPLRSSGSSNKSSLKVSSPLSAALLEKENYGTGDEQPLKKRVKFSEAFYFPTDMISLPNMQVKGERPTLRNKIYEFFAKLF